MHSGRTVARVQMLAVAALVAFTALARTEVAFAGEAFVPPTVDVTISGVSNQPSAGGGWLVTLAGTVTNNAGVAFDDVELLLLVGAGALRSAAGVLSVGALGIQESRAVRWEFEAPAPWEPEAGPTVMLAGSATGDGGERRALRVDADVEVRP